MAGRIDKYFKLYIIPKQNILDYYLFNVCRGK